MSNFHKMTEQENQNIAEETKVEQKQPELVEDAASKAKKEAKK